MCTFIPAGEDYVGISNVPVQFVEDTLRSCVNISILSDVITEDDEIFVINVSFFDDVVILEDPPPVFAKAPVTIVDSRKFSIKLCLCTYCTCGLLSICTYIKEELSTLC